MLKKYRQATGGWLAVTIGASDLFRVKRDQSVFCYETAHDGLLFGFFAGEGGGPPTAGHGRDSFLDLTLNRGNRVHPVLIDGQWIKANATGDFRAFNPTTGEDLPDVFPVSSWDDCERALAAASRAARELKKHPSTAWADFLLRYADKIESQVIPLAAMAATETGLPETPRLRDVELPRTIGQLRQAAVTAASGNWTLPTIDTATNIRSMHCAIGPVLTIGPNNFPFAFNAISGGDFAAAIAAGNPVIAKAHPAHPNTCRLLAELAAEACRETGMPTGTVQMLYRIGHDDGLRMIQDERLQATGFTGSRAAGMAIKAASDASGKLAYLEMSSVNPVVLLPGALAERGEAIADEFCSSCTMGAGQFCTNPGLVIVVSGEATAKLVRRVAERFSQSQPGTLLSRGVLQSLETGVQLVREAGATLLAGGEAAPGPRLAYLNTLLQTDGATFLSNPTVFQTEMFGNASLFVVVADIEEAVKVLEQLEGNLTGTIYLSESGADRDTYQRVAPILSEKVGRLINNKMPTGVAVSPAMNHGGPYPSTGHPGFTAVGFPSTARRFSRLQCFDAVHAEGLPPELQNRNPNGALWRLIDGNWTQGDVGA